MDCAKTGALLKKLRKEKNLTQKQVAEKMNISNKTVCKWERGLGCPDVSLLSELSDIFGVKLEELLQGELSTNNFVNGNMLKTNFYVCPLCNNVTVCTGSASIYCCGRKINPLSIQKANTQNELFVESSEDEWYITSSHPMDKENYISFVAFLSGNQLSVYKQYPEWEIQVRISKHMHGKLIWYSKKEGLFEQDI